MSSDSVVIIGAGIAGAATAYFLSRQGVKNVVLLDREKQPGVHSTGRNAAILRTAIPHPELHHLGWKSKQFYESPPPGFTETPLVDPVGLFLAATDDQIVGTSRDLQAWLEDPTCSKGGENADPSQLYDLYPELAKRVDYVHHFANEGVFDVDAILSGFLRGARQAGVEVRLCNEARRLLVENGKIVGVATDEEVIPAQKAVLAGGGWAADLADAAGYPLPLQPIRRHILVTARIPELDPKGPVVWLGGDEFYFRPESGGLLMSACDTQPVSAAEGELAQHQTIEEIAIKAERWLPGFDQLGAAHYWAGMRTFAPDPLFVVGPDPRLSGLHWVAGLGGHGITCGAAVGSLAADWICGKKSSYPYARDLLPGRFFDQSDNRSSTGIEIGK
ncbi:MAG: FAD-binding oxidoreductase [Planctomycetes bacterium]|nr:FAD-binding oxidoreductase [Planctomycetota bacterium]